MSIKSGASAGTSKANQYHASITKAHTLALSSNLNSVEIKKAIATTLLKCPKTDVDKPELPKVYEDSTLHGFIHNES